MLATKKELGAIVLLVLISLTSGLPYQRARRSIIKDYFNPLTYPTDPIQFKKGDDGKYHLSKSIDSNVDYATAHGIDASNEIMDKTMKSSSLEKNAKADHTADVKNEEAFGEVPKKELEKEEIEGVIITENDSAKKIFGSDEKDKLDILSKAEAIEKINSDVKSEEIEKKMEDKELKSAAKSDIPIDSKWSLVPKPDGKDDKPFRSDDAPEEYLPEPPTVPGKKEGDGKLGIGQIPHVYPVLIPPRMPMFIPKHFLLRISSPVPAVPPAVHVSDRLPLPDADVVEESAETAVIENVAPGGPMVIKEGRKFVTNHFVHPLRIALSLPFMPVGKVLTEAVDGNKLKGHVKSEIVNINGKKLLLQRKVLKSLADDPSHLHVSVMSIQPLEDVNPKILKELEKEHETEDKFHEKEMKHEEEEDLEEKTRKKIFLEDPEKMDESSIAKESPLDPELLELEKTEAEAKKEVAIESIPPIPATDAEKTIKHEEEEKIKEVEAKDEVAETSEEDSSIEEFGIKKNVAVDELEVKKEGINIVLAEEEKKNKEIANDNIDKVNIEEDEIVGAKDLFHLINQKSKDVVVDGIITEVEPEENAFKIESQIKDKEVAESKTVEVEVKPIEEPKDMLEKVDAGEKISHEEEKMISKDKDVLDAPGVFDTEEKKTDEEKKFISEDEDIFGAHSFKDTEEKITEEEKLILEDKDVLYAHSVADSEEKVTDEEKLNLEDKAVLDAHRAKDTEEKAIEEEKLNSKDKNLHDVIDDVAKKDIKEIDIKISDHSEEEFKNKDFELTEAKGVIFAGRKKEYDLEKRKEKKKPKKKCKCEEEDDSDSDSDEE